MGVNDFFLLLQIIAYLISWLIGKLLCNFHYLLDAFSRSLLYISSDQGNIYFLKKCRGTIRIFGNEKETRQLNSIGKA